MFTPESPISLQTALSWPGLAWSSLSIVTSRTARTCTPAPSSAALAYSAVFELEVTDSTTASNPDAATLHADAAFRKGFAHPGEFAGLDLRGEDDVGKHRLRQEAALVSGGVKLRVRFRIGRQTLESNHGESLISVTTSRP